jgi:hypothetical protein
LALATVRILNGSPDLELRTGAANSTNNPHLSNPNPNISAANFLVMTSAQPDQRQVRLGLRLSW